MADEILDDDISGSAPSTDSDFPDYPKHSETFETYYYLGDKRSLRMCASIRFKNLMPDIAETDPRYPTKFTSFYMKIKRWARKEGWNYWVRKKEYDDRKASSKETQSRIMRSTQSVQAYRSVLQQAVFVFAKKAARSMKLVQESMKIEELLDDPDLSMARKLELEKRLEMLNSRISEADVRIKNLKEARECMQLEVDLGKVIDSMPEVLLDGKEKLSEQMSEKCDAVMEFFRRHAKDSSVKKDDSSSSSEDLVQ